LKNGEERKRQFDNLILRIL